MNDMRGVLFRRYSQIDRRFGNLFAFPVSDYTINHISLFPFSMLYEWGIHSFLTGVLFSTAYIIGWLNIEQCTGFSRKCSLNQQQVLFRIHSHNLQFASRDLGSA